MPGDLPGVDSSESTDMFICLCVHTVSVRLWTFITALDPRDDSFWADASCAKTRSLTWKSGSLNNNHLFLASGAVSPRSPMFVCKRSIQCL